MDNKKIIDFLKANDINPLLLDPIKQDASNRSYFRIKDIRLTIDKNIAYKKFSNGKISNFSTVDNYNIVELKYDVRQSVDYVIKNFPFERVRFSKYCRGIEFTRLNYCNEI